MNVGENSGTRRKVYISKVHDKFLEKDKGKFKRVKFESPKLKYNLTELYNNPVGFNEPVPNYDLMDDFSPTRKLKYDLGRDEKLDLTKMNKHEIDELDNLAIINQTRVKEKDHATDTWKRVTKKYVSHHAPKEYHKRFKKLV